MLSGFTRAQHSQIPQIPGTAPLSAQHPSLDPRPPTHFTGHLHNGWSSLNFTAHSQHSQTCSSGTWHSQVPLGVPASSHHVPDWSILDPRPATHQLVRTTACIHTHSPKTPGLGKIEKLRELRKDLTRFNKTDFGGQLWGLGQLWDKCTDRPCFAHDCL